MFKVSRSPIREALFALENEGAVTTEPYRRAIQNPLSTEEVSDIAELRLALITLQHFPLSLQDSHAGRGVRLKYP
jgi:DNA-binding GntR family transcriptional regulator